MRIGFIGLGAMGLPMAGHLVGGRPRRDRRLAQPRADRRRGGPGCRRRRLAPGRGRGLRGRHPVRPQLARGGRGGRRHAAGPRRRARPWSTARPSTPRWSGPSTRGSARPARATSTRRCRAARPAPRRARSPSWSAATPTSLAETEPALEPFAGLVVHVGGPGMGQVVKLCNNLIYAAQMTATAEATAMAVKSGRRHGQAATRCSPTPPATAWPCGPACPCPGWSPRARRRTAGSPAS